jgi:hypothetical protein
MSVVSRLVEDLVGLLLDQVKLRVRDYADLVLQDLELVLERIIRRAVRAVVLGLLGAVLVSVGMIFSLVGLAVYLGQLVNPAAGWGVVGLVAMASGALVLSLLQRRGRAERHLSRLDGEG